MVFCRGCGDIRLDLGEEAAPPVPYEGSPAWEGALETVVRCMCVCQGERVHPEMLLGFKSSVSHVISHGGPPGRGGRRR